MALIRGTNGKCPCPICYVPKERQGQVVQTYPICVAETVQQIFQSLKDASKSKQEKTMKHLGLCYIMVSKVFLCINFLLTEIIL